MKLNVGLRLVGLCGAFAASAFAQNPRGASEPSPAVSAKEKESASTEASASPALTRAEALKLITTSRQYVAHPTPPPPKGKIAEPQVKTPDFQMAEPPPAPRPETKPEAPGTGYVWVAGHYMPVKGEWRWVMGEWAVPATPISVWIPARYDENEKKWAPGYWQPDVATTAAPEPTAKDAKPATKAGDY